MQFRKTEHPINQKLLKRGHHVRKTGQVRPLLPDKCLGLILDILNCVLARVVWSKPATGDQPIVLRHPGVHLRKIVPHRRRFVVAGIIPDNRQLAVGKPQVQIQQEVSGGQCIGGFAGHQMGDPRHHIHGPIVCLSGTHVTHGYRHTFVAFAPHIPAGIAP